MLGLQAEMLIHRLCGPITSEINKKPSKRLKSVYVTLKKLVHNHKNSGLLLHGPYFVKEERTLYQLYTRRKQSASVIC
jgi:hypothetical protein